MDLLRDEETRPIEQSENPQSMQRNHKIDRAVASPDRKNLKAILFVALNNMQMLLEN